MSAELMPPPERMRTFVPNSWAQQESFADTHTEFLYSGALGTSKSRTACEKLDARCRLYPGAVVGLVRRFRTDLGRTTLQTYFRDVVTPSEKAWGWRKTEDGGSTMFYANGSRLLAVGCDSLGPIRGTEFDLLAVDQAEEMDAELWVELLSRCRHRHGPFQGLSGYCNPDSPAHFLYKRFRLDLGNDVRVTTRAPMDLPNGERIPKGYELRRAVFAAPGDNSQNLTTSNLITLETMTGVQRMRLKEGQWVMPFGLVYPEFNAPTHVIARPTSWAKWGGYPPPTYPRIMGVDFGYKNAASLLWIAIDPDDRMFVYRELYATQKRITDLGRQAAELEAIEWAAIRDVCRAHGESLDFHGLNIHGRYCDHDAGEAALLDEIFAEAGTTTTTPAEKGRINDGLNRVRRRLNGSQATGPELFFLRDMLVEEDELIEEGEPRSVLQEFPVYQYPKRGRNETSSDERFDVPVDRRNHGLAALRYAVASYETEARVSVVG